MSIRLDVSITYYKICEPQSFIHSWLVDGRGDWKFSDAFMRLCGPAELTGSVHATHIKLYLATPAERGFWVWSRLCTFGLLIYDPVPSSRFWCDKSIHKALLELGRRW